jgi:hypothetical protein
MTYPNGIDALVDVNPTQTLAAGGHAARHNSTNTALAEVRDWLAAPTQSVQASDYTFTADDVYRLTVMTGGSAVTIPPASSVDWDAGTQLAVLNQGSATVTVTAGSGVTLNGSGTALAQYAGGVAVRTGSDEFTFVPFSGAGSASPSGIPNADFSNAATGTYTDSGINYKYITYTASGTLTVTTAGFADVLLIGGGGGGGRFTGGGGGAGGYNEISDAYLPVGTLTVTVGAGGSGAIAGLDASRPFSGSSGLGSGLHAYFAVGGGLGGIGNDSRGGQAGGSGGGGGGNDALALPGGSGTSGQGNSGGSSLVTTGGGAGGGGGANASGGNATVGPIGGSGGSGKANSFTGSSVTRAGGGGGGSQSGTAGSGGAGGGGGATTNNTAGTAGTANTGGGGGGGGFASGIGADGGNGGSGVVIIRVRTN